MLCDVRRITIDQGSMKLMLRRYIIILGVETCGFSWEDDLVWRCLASLGMKSPILVIPAVVEDEF